MTAFLELRAVTRHHRDGSRVVRAVDGVTLEIHAGETLGLVGESGSGKSTLGRLALGLEAPTSGTVLLEGTDLGSLDAAALRRLRRRIQPIFQDPLGALNPRRTIGDSIAEGLRIHRLVPRGAIADRVAQLLAEVGLEPEAAGRRPEAFSGGQRQRVGIARALAVEPSFLVCDEPVSALDVSIQAQVLALLLNLRDRRGLSWMFIGHDLAVVRQMTERMAVMYRGTIVETGPTRSVIAAPRHPYTRSLVAAVPVPVVGTRPATPTLADEPPSPSAALPGCPFVARCPHPRRDERCHRERPALVALDGHGVACHHESAR